MSFFQIATWVMVLLAGVILVCHKAIQNYFMQRREQAECGEGEDLE